VPRTLIGEDGSIQSVELREFVPRHSSDALYQGTTLVGPLRSNKDLGFSPCVRTSNSSLFHGFGRDDYSAAEHAIARTSRLIPNRIVIPTEAHPDFLLAALTKGHVCGFL
jgi:hypothetical protein